MKKFLTIILATILMATLCVPMLTLTVSALTVAGNVSLNYGTVAIDGNFTADKWLAASPLTIDASNSVTWAGDLASTVKVYGLWDEDGLYFGGEATDSTFTYSNSRYDGDAVQFSLDLGQTFFGSDEARAIWYSFGSYENAGDQTVCVDESADNRDIADGETGVKIKTGKSANGWIFEMFLPWSVLNGDLDAKAGKTFTPAAAGKINALICYLDRDGGELLCASGTFAAEEPDWGPAGHGVTFVLQEKPAPAVEVEVEVEEAAPPADNTPAAQEEVPVVVSTPPAVNTGDPAILLIVGLLSVSLAAAGVLKVSKKKS